jgi:hypothetical protein
MYPSKSNFKTTVFKSPDLSKMKAVIIDHRTTIYIALDADIEEARTRYFLRKSNILLK